MKHLLTVCLTLAVSVVTAEPKRYVMPEDGPRLGTFIFDTRYVANNGSYLTNDVCHIALIKTALIIPDNTEVWCYYRGIDQTNAEDWVQFTPVLTIADFPHDYYLENAISNDVTVTANYIPPSPVVTNLLFSTGVKIAMGAIPVSSLPLVVPGSHLETVSGTTTNSVGILYKSLRKEEDAINGTEE